MEPLKTGTIKTKLELYRVVMGGSGGYRRLPGGSAHFSLQTDTHFIIIYISSFSSSSSFIIEIHSTASFLSAFTLLGLPAEVYMQVTNYHFRPEDPTKPHLIDQSAKNLNNDNLQGTQFLSVVAFTPITAFVLISTFLPIFHNLQVQLKERRT